MNTGWIPEEWQDAKVTKRNKSEPAIYTPVSLRI